MNELDLIVKEIGLLDESAYDVRIKNANNVPDGDIKLILQCDPVLATVDPENLQNAPESYFRWLLKMFKTYGKDILEASDFIRSLLTSFSEMKNAQGLLRIKDINQIKSIKELEEIVSEAKEKMSSRQKERQARKDKKKLQSTEKEVGKVYLNGGAKLIFMDDEYEIWEPLTFEGSMALGKKSRWCTSKDKQYYDDYMKKGKLFICFPKNGSLRDAFQIHIDSNNEYEIRDINDVLVDMKDMSEWMDEDRFQKFLNIFGLDENDLIWEDDRGENIEAYLMDEFGIAEMYVSEDVREYAEDEYNIDIPEVVVGKDISLKKITDSSYMWHLLKFGVCGFECNIHDKFDDNDLLKLLSDCILFWKNEEKFELVGSALYRLYSLQNLSEIWDEQIGEKSEYDGYTIANKLFNMGIELYRIPNKWLFENNFIPNSSYIDNSAFMNLSLEQDAFYGSNAISFYENVIKENDIYNKEDFEKYLDKIGLTIPKFNPDINEIDKIFEKYNDVIEEIYKNLIFFVDM